MDVYFLRHGDYDRQGAAMSGSGDQPLNAAGAAAMEAEAVAIARLIPGLDMVITSPLARARQTAQIVGARLAARVSPVVDQRLAPGFSKRELAHVLADHAERKALMLVGHEPDFSRTIAACIGGGRVELRKGALACVRVEDTAAVTGTLLCLLSPEALTS
jgi:phosphohistidine phosphatase